jgi:hypothetical protein
LEWFFGTEEKRHDQNLKKCCGGQTASEREFVLSREFLFSDIPGKNGFCGRIKQASNRAEKLSRSRWTVSFCEGYR